MKRLFNENLHSDGISITGQRDDSENVQFFHYNLPILLLYQQTSVPTPPVMH